MNAEKCKYCDEDETNYFAEVNILQGYDAKRYIKLYASLETNHMIVELVPSSCEMPISVKKIKVKYCPMCGKELNPNKRIYVNGVKVYSR